MKRFLLSFIALLACFSFMSVGCNWLTETGNPNTTPEPPQAMPEEEDRTGHEAEVYINEVYGVTVTYPEGWIVAAPSEEDDDEDVDLSELSQVLFYDGRDPATTALMTFKRLDEEPESFLEYLDAAYPDREFGTYSTGTYESYYYDNPETGPNGGDLREYYFLEGTVLVKVEAEIFEDGQAELTELLSGISFNQ